MAFDFGNVGDLSGWGMGNSTPVRPITDLSPHVDGGQSSTYRTVAAASADDVKVLHNSAAIVIGALIALWLIGGLAFRSHNL